MKRYLEFVIHGVITAAFLVFLNNPGFDLTFGVFQSGDLSLLWPSVIGTAFNALLFYGIVYYLVPQVLRQKGSWIFLLALSGVFFGISFLEIITDSAFATEKYGPLTFDQWTEISGLVIFGHVLIMIIALAYKFTQDWMANEKIQRSMNEWKLQSELDLLKSQINPHFLFNALNSLFSMALQHKDEKTAEGISKLAEMMRYVFDRSADKWVPVTSEIQYIEDYNYLQLLRFGEHVQVTFTHPDHLDKERIAPMLLIPFVENAFKYGVSTQMKTLINIDLSVQADDLLFTISSEIVERTETIASSGIGINNVKKRLELLYPGKHELEINEKVGRFNVSLKLMIK